ncbi:CCR4-NOT transcription complex subunit 4 isoform X2 [Brevipalpus obovatus]|uniref:CCR4-NOT transcription complex subunit 4 isoform X2 n=1 Tax=Brevipalpus obovatus TaxID=246614 RepID=UPI003D9E5282
MATLRPLSPNRECPLCLEPIEADDIDFYPCPCGYQICRFCWHRLANEENGIEPGKSGRGLCPACRQEYPESPVGFNSNLTIEAMTELVKNKKKKRKQANKLKSTQQQQDRNGRTNIDGRKDEKNLAGLRVVQKNLVFVIGIPSRLSQEDLRREFSKFGKIHKLVIGNNTSNQVNSAYVTYSRPEDAIKAIQTLNQSNQCNQKGTNLTLRASLGTTKYCTHWLKNMQCPKLPDCMYLHELADSEASFRKEEMQQGKHIEYERKLIAQCLSKKSANGAGISQVDDSGGSLSKNSTKHCSVGFDKEFNNNLCSYSSNEEVSVGDEKSPSSDSESFIMSDNRLNDNEHHLQQIDNSTYHTRIKYDTIDEMIGISSDSSTSFSTCSSGSSVPLQNNAFSQGEEEEVMCESNVADEDEESGKENRCKSPSNDEPMQPSSSPGHSIDDDGLDFDPITVSTNGLEDLIRSNAYNDESSSVNCTGLGYNFGHNSVPTVNATISSSDYLSSPHFSNLRQQHQQQQQQPPLIRTDPRSALNQQEHWRNSLKALLPNVNIKFAPSTSRSFNGFHSTPPIPSQSHPQSPSHRQQQQHQQQQFSHPLHVQTNLASQMMPWFHQTLPQHQSHHSSQVNPFFATQSCQIPLNKTHHEFLTRSVMRQKQPPPGFANF